MKKAELGFAFGLAVVCLAALTEELPTTPLQYGAFKARFSADGAFSLEGQGWPAFTGTWRRTGETIEIKTSGGGCEAPGRYRVLRDGATLGLELVSDECRPRRMILDRSIWARAGEAKSIPERRILRTAAPARRVLPKAADAAGSWPTFRGPLASGIAEGQNLPDTWNGKTGDNVLWRTPIPGLGHSSPVVWGDRVFVTSAVSSKADATFRPGLYGDGDASDDRSQHRFLVQALDKKTGKLLWERVAHEGEPIDKRHIKSTYASTSPATDGRLVVAWFGSQGVHAYDVDGNFLWKVDVGRTDMGAYDIPSFEWGPASSPILWNGLVILQCDTQADSFLLALNAETGATVWKADRGELPSWGTPTVATTEAGPELVTNASNFVRGYDPRSGKELWRLGKSSKITAPTPVFSDGLFVVASGRAPERPVFVVKAGARGDLTLPEGQTSSAAIAWSRSGRGSYMPTPLIYGGLLYVLSNNGLFDAYDLKTGAELYRERLANVGSGFSSSPVGADGKLYLSSEDGEMLVLVAGPKFQHLATNPIGELLMATPALSEGVLYVRSSQSLFAIGRKRAEAPWKSSALATAALLCASVAAGQQQREAAATKRDLLFEQLQNRIEQIAAGLDGVMGVAILDLADGRALLRNAEQVFPTASSIKLPLLIELYRQEQQARAGAHAKARLGDLYTFDPKDLVDDSGIMAGLTPGVTRVTNRDLAQFMVAVSDNAATNVLYERVGKDNVNAMLRGLGLQHTLLRRRMMDLAAARRGDENVATPRELVALLQALHDGKLLDKELTAALLEQLATSKKDSWLTGALPDGLRVANKSGTLGAVRTDSGIVYAPNRPFAISVMTSYVRDERSAEAAIGQIALAAYRHFEMLGKSSEYGRELPPAVK